jgi:hypothetical protein
LWASSSEVIITVGSESEKPGEATVWKVDPTAGHEEPPIGEASYSDPIKSGRLAGVVVQGSLKRPDFSL